MGQKISVYLSDDSITLLDKLVGARTPVYGLQASRSGTLDDLIRQHGQQYLETLQGLRAIVEKYTAGKFAPERKPINPNEFETFDSLEEYAAKDLSDEEVEEDER